MLLFGEIVAAISVVVVFLCLQTPSRGYRIPGYARPPLVTRFSVLPQAFLSCKRETSEEYAFRISNASYSSAVSAPAPATAPATVPAPATAPATATASALATATAIASPAPATAPAAAHVGVDSPLALHAAIANSDVNKIKELLTLAAEGKFDLKAVDSVKNTPLHIAVKVKNSEVVKLLIEAGAPLAGVNSDGCNFVDLAFGLTPAKPLSSVIFESAHNYRLVYPRLIE